MTHFDFLKLESPHFHTVIISPVGARREGTGSRAGEKWLRDRSPPANRQTEQGNSSAVAGNPAWQGIGSDTAGIKSAGSVASVNLGDT
jgi:hypothetical protein